jgi:hypothetical protein
VNYLTPNLGISFNNYLELQQHKKQTADSCADDTRAPTPSLTYDCPPQDELVATALEIINIARKGVQEKLEKLQGTCLSLEDEVRAVTAR